MNILIIDEMHPSIIPLLEHEGFKVNYRPDISRSEIETVIDQYHGLILRSKTTMDRPLLEIATQLRLIGRAGVGLDKIDVDYLTSRNLTFYNAPQGSRYTVTAQLLATSLA